MENSFIEAGTDLRRATCRPAPPIAAISKHLILGSVQRK